MPLPSALFAELQEGFKFTSRERARMILKTIVPVKPHGLRHQFATLARKGGVPLDARARLMDHTLPGSLTESVYGDWPHDRLRKEQCY